MDRFASQITLLQKQRRRRHFGAIAAVPYLLTRQSIALLLSYTRSCTALTTHQCQSDLCVCVCELNFSSSHSYREGAFGEEK